jgi:Tol biopolymer transport system component
MNVRKCWVLILCALPFFACNELISLGLNSAPGDANSFNARVSGDGRFVVFDSLASNLVPNDTNGSFDVFLRDRTNFTTERISVTNAGFEAIGSSATPQISDDGRFVVFASSSPDLVPAGITVGVLVRDRALGTTRFLGEGRRPVISADGKWVAFLQNAVFVTTPVGTQVVTAGNPLLVNLETGEIDTTLSRQVRTAADLSFSADGRVLAFSLYLLIVNPVPGQQVGAAQVGGCSVRVFDRSRQVVDLVGAGSTGAGSGVFTQRPSVSADGRIIAFDSTDPSLVPGDTNRTLDVFSADRTTGGIERISVSDSGEQNNSGAGFASVSADGDRVVFASFASNLEVGDSNGLLDVFVRVRSRNLTRRVSIVDGGAPSNAEASGADISSDGRVAVYLSTATNLTATVDAGTAFDIFAKPVDEVLPALP